MPGNMSFAMTTEQIKEGTKLVTRRFGWWKLKPSTDLWAVEKAMGLKKGEKIKRLRLIHVVSVRTEPLNAITQEECKLEGFPEMSPDEFVSMLCKKYKCSPESPINRIQFIYV
jgi:hypothetical protein